MSRYLGLDYGLERTGAAISDPAGTLAFPFGVFRLSDYSGRKALLDALAEKAKGAGVEAIVMGLPLFADGNENLMCRRVRNFAARLQRRLGLPVYYVSEYLTSEVARQELRNCGKFFDHKAGVIDQQAACDILQAFLDNPHSKDSP